MTRRTRRSPSSSTRSARSPGVRAPARAIGLDDRTGALTPGLRADLVELDGDLRVRRVMRAGAWVS